MLGPLLFLVCINDIPNCSKLFNFLMYADDTTFYCCPLDIDSLNSEQTLNDELQCVNSWLSANKLALKANKSKYKLFGSITIHTYHSTFSDSKYFSEIEKFHGFQHINTSRITLHNFIGLIIAE